MEEQKQKLSGAPRIVIPHHIYEKCVGWMEATGDEVSWRGLADWNEKEFRITDIFLPVQTSSGAHVEVPTAQDGGDISKWLTDCIRKRSYQNAQKECRYKWHMHKHPGSDWGSLFESGTDINNTAKFGVREIKWMMVGRAVDTGKFRICLEVFRPFRLGIDFLPVFVEYKGALHKVSEPEREPSIEGVLNFSFSNESMLLQIEEGEKYFSKIELTEEEVQKPLYSGYSNLSYPYLHQPSYQTEIKRVAKVVALSKSPIDTQLQCVIEKVDGAVVAQVKLKIASWELNLQKIHLKIDLPELSAIRAEAAKEVKEKVSATYSFSKVGDFLRPWEKKSSKNKTEDKEKKTKKDKKGGKNGGTSKGSAKRKVSGLFKSGPNESQLSNYDYWGRRDW